MIFQQLSIALGVISLIGFFASSGKQKRISAILLGSSLLLGIISFSVLSPYSQHPSVLKDSKQQQLAPAPVEENPSTERMVWGGEKIILAGDGNYFIPRGKKSLCITALGMKDGSTLVPQDLDVGGTLYSELGSRCQEMPPGLAGQISVDFSPGKPWGTKEAILQIYKEYDSKPGGIGQFPFIAIGM